MKKQKICFVIMGFGKKTDFESGRTLDLDATYEAIIQPAVEYNDLRCIRANEILHSGVIDVKMYEMLLRADLVIADISTNNVNAIYELGVRHALRPFSTIIIKEKDGKYHFDLDHINIFSYTHMGDDIGSREAKRASNDLKILIKETLDKSIDDSPVYTFIPTLQKPSLSDKKYNEFLDDAEEIQERFSSYFSKAESAAKDSNHIDAAIAFKDMLELNPDNDYLIQQFALHKYKSKQPSESLALNDASAIINRLSPETSKDPETLGIAGAIYKNMWKLSEDRETLDRAITFYKRGFDLRQDYYNGENAASCIESRSILQKDENEAQFDRMTANKIRTNILDLLLKIVADVDFDQRSDQKWVFATLANCSLAIGNKKQSNIFEKKFKELSTANWEHDTYNEGKAVLLKFLKNSIS